MATATMTSLPPSPSPSPSPPNPSLTPLPLSASQESQVLALYHKRVRTKCADQLRDFATCCSSRPFTASFFCKPQQKAMNACMLQFANQAEMDRAREEWFRGIEERKVERERKEEKRKVDEVFWRNWWSREEGARLEKGKEEGVEKRR